MDMYMCVCMDMKYSRKGRWPRLISFNTWWRHCAQMKV